MDKLSTLKEFAEYLNCSTKTASKYVEKYEIPHIKLGRDLRFDLEEVKTHLKTVVAGGAVDLPDLKAKKPIGKLQARGQGSEKYASMLGL